MAETQERAMLVAGLRDDLTDLEASVEQVAKRIDRGVGGRELALAKTKLQEARHWLVEASEQIAN